MTDSKQTKAPKPAEAVKPDLATLRERRTEAAAAGDAALTAHLDNLVREAEAVEAEQRRN